MPFAAIEVEVEVEWQWKWWGKLEVETAGATLNPTAGPVNFPGTKEMEHFAGKEEVQGSSAITEKRRRRIAAGKISGENAKDRG